VAEWPSSSLVAISLAERGESGLHSSAQGPLNQSNIHNIASLVAPAGSLIVSACGAADHYKVGTRRFSSSRATPEDVLSALQREGFASIDLRVRLTPSHTSQGYSSVIFARGTRLT
jgi:hypothetical protein